MAMLPAMRALTCGLGVAGALLVGPALDSPAASATPVGIAADDPAQPTAPDPGAQAPVNQGPPQAEPPMHRRHIDGDPLVTR